MFDLLKSMGFSLIMVPVVMAAILALIYVIGELFNVISKTGNTGQQP
ncbi:multidrug efflux pump-associated protein, AcrZ family [Xenorhabdus sp. 42]|uniref:Multidrug efflux pump accessory protein AcrZ n=3 Tax=Xenorhabdus szentirmaii TaxID=290112 RepID=W1IX96_9GAMM|nr:MULTISPECIES: AcrZ family multidrug efflux pump-associated protein [Xenorhabdus]MBD2782603.1 multidrug efflux pump-associated protein, AcrZ family [Xenorhabdus sp. 38]MBD2791615.1 multidrug efflux pump-associated protein, AcrZ family [Xenorhabdus sp. CUL]MBD2799010.1 multidrug efflux pump-associated protein, AcrZ family [Xenorhabdus sp. M]MBD2806823.1 multidrug efflux pump-associated protein, AcrZ family [Xenorhabdus sp. ZM]MBD2821509.1 multidrug efflux pump-associated protein, AcrZ family 